MRIARIIESYPERKIVLFGDDSQRDPYIYTSLVNHFPATIYAVYIRRIHKTNYIKVQAAIDNMINSGTRCCYFTHSKEAIEHSKLIGLIE